MHRPHSFEKLDIKPSLVNPSHRSSFHHEPPVPVPPYKRSKRVARRTWSLDRGSEAYYRDWTGQTFSQSPALLSKTDPQDTASLWELVRMVNSDKKRIPPTRGASKENKSASGTTSVTASSLAETVNTTVSQQNPQRTKRPSPYDRSFRLQVLDPHSIRIKRFGLSQKAHAHFEAPEPSGHRFQYYTQKRKAVGSSVWVEADTGFIEGITREYTRMERLGLCETEFASYAKEMMLKRDPFIMDPREERRWGTTRMLELVAKPDDDSKWQCPPLVGQETPVADPLTTGYEFDIRPDCEYWLSLQAFNPEYLSQVHDWTFVMHDEITCPYFTIEFKKDDRENIPAINQVAVAASVALYNRFCLRERRLQLAEEPWTKNLTKILRHYGLTWQGKAYIVWYITPILSDYAWAGCHMTEIFRGNCTRPVDVGNLIDWINEIHCWGLTVHGPSCAKDIKLSMKTQSRLSGLRVSNVFPGSEDEPDSPEQQEHPPF